VSEWPDALLRDLGAPRPLPHALRARLEDALVATAPAAIRHDDADAEDGGDDDVAVALTGLGGPRPVPGARRQAMADALVRTGRDVRAARRRGLAVAAAVVLLVGGGTAVALSLTGRQGATTTAQRPQRHSVPAAGGGASGGSGVLPSAGAPVPSAAPGITDNAASAGGSGGANTALGVAQPGPTVTALTPDSGRSAGGAVVVVTGTGFVHVTAVTFGGVPAAFTVVSPTEIRAVTPAHGAGTVDVVVSASGGSSATGAGDQFRYG